MGKTRRTATFIWAAMLVVPFAFLGLAGTIGGEHAAPHLAGPLLALSAVGAAGNVVLARVLPPRLGPARAQDREAVAFTRVLVSLALCEAAALAPVVAHLVTRDPRLHAVLAAAVGALVAFYPSDRRWGALLPQADPVEGPAAGREAP